MVDGTQVVAGTGDTIWTEDTGDARGKIQRTKIALGVLDNDGGDVASSNPLPVLGAHGTKTFTTSAPTTAAAQCLAANASRKKAIIYNNGSVVVYLGKDGTVTSSNGLPLLAGASLEDDASTDAWYAITVSGTGDLRVLEVA